MQRQSWQQELAPPQPPQPPPQSVQRGAYSGGVANPLQEPAVWGHPDMSEIFPQSAGYPSVKDTTINVNLPSSPNMSGMADYSYAQPQPAQPQPQGAFHSAMTQQHALHQQQYQQQQAYSGGRRDPKSASRVVISFLLMCCVIGIAGVGMLISYGSKGSKYDNPCTGDCVTNANSLTRECVNGDGCCAALTVANKDYASSCTERSKKLLTAGILCVVLLVLAIIGSACAYSLRQARVEQQAEEAAARDPEAVPQQAPHPHDLSLHPPPPFSPSTQSAPVVSTEPDVYWVDVPAEAAAEGEPALGEDICGVYTKRLDVLWNCPVWETEDGRVLSATGRESWGVTRGGELVAESAPQTVHRLPDRLVEPLVWQLLETRRGGGRGVRDWVPAKRVRFIELHAEGATVEVRLDEGCEKEGRPARWVDCRVDRVLLPDGFGGEEPKYVITVLKTTRYGNAAGLSGKTMDAPVPSAWLRKLVRSPQRSARDVLKTPPKREPTFQSRNILVRTADTSNAHVTVVRGSAEADNMLCILEKLGLQADEAEHYVMLDGALNPVAPVYDDVREGEPYFVSRIDSADEAEHEAAGPVAPAVTRRRTVESRLNMSDLDVSHVAEEAPAAPAAAAAAVVATPVTVPVARRESPVATLAALKDRLSLPSEPAVVLRGPAGSAQPAAAQARGGEAAFERAYHGSDAGSRHATPVRGGGSYGGDFSEKGSPSGGDGAPQASSVDRRREVLSLHEKIMQFSQRHGTPVRGERY